MIKPTYTKPPEFKSCKAKITAWADKVYVKNSVICLYFNNAIYARFVQVSIDELGDFKQAQKKLIEIYQDASEEDLATIKYRVEYIAGELFKMGVLKL